MADAPPYPVYRVEVVRTERLATRLLRLTVDAQGVPGIRTDLPAQWVKLFVRDAEGRLSSGRAYTIRRVHAATGALDIDVVLHGRRGRISGWAEAARPGAVVETSAPHPRTGFTVDPDARDYLFVGDETSLPAIAAILEALPASAHATVVAELARGGCEMPLRSPGELAVHWLHRGARGMPKLRDALRMAPPRPGAIVWVGAESAEVAAIRARLRTDAAYASCRIHAVGYWKRGEADHIDSDAIL